MKDDSVATTVTFIFFILFLVGVFCPVPDWFIGVFVVGLPITINIITSIFFIPFQEHLFFTKWPF